MARSFLEKKGFEILEQNFRCRFGELDLVCKKNGNLVFVEVKTRRSTVFGEGVEAVDARKQGKMLKTALYYLHKNKMQNSSFQFDVISIQSGKEERVDHLEHVFP